MTKIKTAKAKVATAKTDAKEHKYAYIQNIWVNERENGSQRLGISFAKGVTATFETPDGTFQLIGGTKAGKMIAYANDRKRPDKKDCDFHGVIRLADFE